MPLRSAATARLRLVTTDAAPDARPKGSRRPYRDTTVSLIREFIETTPLTYAEIAAKTGVAPATICRWARDAGWKRHLFAPRATDTVPRERAGARLKLRTLAARIAAVAERYVRELEETPGVDLEKLAEALALLKMAKLTARQRLRLRRPSAAALQKREARLLSEGRSLGPHATPALRLLGELRAAGIDLDTVPEAMIKDYIQSRVFLYTDPAVRPRNRTRRQRHEDWMRAKIADKT